VCVCVCVCVNMCTCMCVALYSAFLKDARTQGYHGPLSDWIPSDSVIVKQQWRKFMNFSNRVSSIKRAEFGGVTFTTADYQEVVQYVLYMSCICPVYVLYMSCICPVYVLYMSCICPVYVLYMSCHCMSCICPVYVLHMSCICPVYAFLKYIRALTSSIL
jgi:hypothetical protein